MCAALLQTRVCANCSRPELTSAAASEFVTVELRAKRSTKKRAPTNQQRCVKHTIITRAAVWLCRCVAVPLCGCGSAVTLYATMLPRTR